VGSKPSWLDPKPSQWGRGKRTIMGSFRGGRSPSLLDSDNAG